MRTMLTTNLTTLLSQVLTLIGSIVILLNMNARYPLFILALAPILILIAFAFGSRIHKGSMKVQDQLADLTVVAEEGLQGIRIVKSFGRVKTMKRSDITPRWGKRFKPHYGWLCTTPYLVRS